MGKKRVVKKTGGEFSGEKGRKAVSSAPKKKVDSVVLYIDATYNNTKGTLTDPSGNALSWTSSGSLGFKGAKKGTPFAAAKIGEILGEAANSMGARQASVVVKGVGAGRESAVRSFASKGISISSIKDITPVPHNGPRPKKPRRV